MTKDNSVNQGTKSVMSFRPTDLEKVYEVYGLEGKTMKSNIDGILSTTINTEYSTVTMKKSEAPFIIKEIIKQSLKDNLVLSMVVFFNKVQKEYVVLKFKRRRQSYSIYYETTLVTTHS